MSGQALDRLLFPELVLFPAEAEPLLPCSRRERTKIAHGGAQRNRGNGADEPILRPGWQERDSPANPESVHAIALDLGRVKPGTLGFYARTG